MFSIDRVLSGSWLMDALYVLTAFPRNHQLIMEAWLYRQVVGCSLSGDQIVTLLPTRFLAILIKSFESLCFAEKS